MGKTPHFHECPRYDINLFDDEAPVMLGNAEYPFLLPSLPGLL